MADTKIDWHARAKTLKIDGRAFIGGVRMPAAGGQTYECFSPVDNRKLASVLSSVVAISLKALSIASPNQRNEFVVEFTSTLKLAENGFPISILPNSAN